MNDPLPRSTNSGNGELLGSTEPRIWTPPLRELTPDTSFGYDVIDFADEILETPLDEWQQWAVIHGGELLPDGRPRFRTVLILVARQNGKTLLAKTLALYWMFVELAPLVLGTSTNRDYAKAVWRELCDQAQTNPLLAAELGPHPVHKVIGEEELRTAAGARYKFAATNRRAGRSLTVHKLLLDELREHDKWDAWNAATNAMNAVTHGQAWCTTNQGDDHAIVLDSLRNAALDHIETGRGDPRLGLMEWSAPNGSDPTDPAALAHANPNLGRRIDPDALRGAAERAKAAGGEELAGFQTEVLCMRVILLDPAIDPDAWDRGGTDTPVDLAQHREHVALGVDIALDGSHATLIAAAVLDDRVHVEVVKAWDGFGCAKAVRAELPAIVAKVQPRALGYFPAGPAAVLVADLQPRRGWPPRRVTVEEIKSEQTVVCMSLSEQVDSGEIIHPNDPMLTHQVYNAQRQRRGDAWVYTRRGSAPIDATYALAAAVQLARTLPPAPPPLTVL